MKPLFLFLFLYTAILGQYALYSMKKITNTKLPLFNLKGHLNMSVVMNNENALIENKDEVNKFSFNHETEINKQGKSENSIYGVDMGTVDINKINTHFLGNIFADEFQKLIYPIMVANFTQQIRESTQTFPKINSRNITETLAPPQNLKNGFDSSNIILPFSHNQNPVEKLKNKIKGHHNNKTEKNLSQTYINNSTNFNNSTIVKKKPNNKKGNAGNINNTTSLKSNQSLPSENINNNNRTSNKKQSNNNSKNNSKNNQTKTKPTPWILGDE